MIGEIEALKAGLKDLRAQRNELLKDPTGWYAIKRPQTSRSVPVPEKYCENGKGVVRNQKEARAHMQWAKKEDLRFNSLILQKKKEIREAENQIKSNFRADIKALKQDGVVIGENTLSERLNRHSMPRALRHFLLTVFLGEKESKKWKPEEEKGAPEKKKWKPEDGLPKRGGQPVALLA